jgi:exopolysaccharide biosynthesis polyprenyl glycosylphosphotransferase
MSISASSRPLNVAVKSVIRPDVRSSKFVRLRKGTTGSSLRVLALLVVDSIGINLAWLLTNIYDAPANSTWNLLAETPLAGFIIQALMMGMIAASGGYQAGEKRRAYTELCKTVTLAILMIVSIAFLLNPQRSGSRIYVLLFWALTTLFLCFGRFVVEQLVVKARRSRWLRYSVCLIADDPDVPRALGLIDQQNRYNLTMSLGAKTLDRAQRDYTFSLLQKAGITEVFVAWDAIKDRQFLYWQFQSLGVILHVLPNGFEYLAPHSRCRLEADFPVMTFRPPVVTGTHFWLKKFFDRLVAVLFLLVMSPVYLLVAGLVRLDSPGPIFYRQTRIGLQGRPFKVWKFRTMVINADQLQTQLEVHNEMQDGILFKMKDDPRITRLGKFLRQYSLDELPQIFNVLLGEMSFVGPRPLPVRDVEKFSESHYIRHEVLPGITGLWQVSGRSNLQNFDDVVTLDRTYIERWSLLLDLTILFRTVGVVLHKTGAY